MRAGCQAADSGNGNNMVYLVVSMVTVYYYLGRIYLLYLVALGVPGLVSEVHKWGV